MMPAAIDVEHLGKRYRLTHEKPALVRGELERKKVECYEASVLKEGLHRSLQLLAEEIDTQHVVIDQLQGQVAQHEALMTQANTALRDQEQGYVALEQAHADLQAEHAKLAQAHERLRSDQAALQVNHAALQEAREKLQLTHLGLAQAHKALRDDQIKLEDAHQELLKNHAALQEANTRLRQQLQHLQGEHERLLVNHRNLLDEHGRVFHEQQALREQLQRTWWYRLRQGVASLRRSTVGMHQGVAKVGRWVLQPAASRFIGRSVSRFVVFWIARERVTSGTPHEPWRRRSTMRTAIVMKYGSWLVFLAGGWLAIEAWQRPAVAFAWFAAAAAGTLGIRFLANVGQLLYEQRQELQRVLGNTERSLYQQGALTKEIRDMMKEQQREARSSERVPV